MDSVFIMLTLFCFVEHVVYW